MNQQEIIKQYMSSLGKKSAESLTVEQRKTRAKKAVSKRWENYKIRHQNKDIV
jgi:hypothetical protein